MIDIAIIMLAYGSALIITAAMFAVVSKLTTKITKVYYFLKRKLCELTAR